MRHRHLILEPSKKKLLDSTKNVLQDVSSPDDEVFIRSDEKIITAEPQVNGRRNKILVATAARIDPLVQASLCWHKRAEVRV